MLTPALEAAVDRLQPTWQAPVREYLRTHSRSSLRATEGPRQSLSHGWLASVLGRERPHPRLGRLTTKSGGFPYLESLEDWPVVEGRRATFIGQLSFEGVRVDGLPAAGVLGAFSGGVVGDEPFQLRWYPQPDLEQAVDLEWPCPSLDREIAWSLEPATSYRLPESWADLLGDDDDPDARLEEVTDLILSGGDTAALPYFGLHGPGPRDWFGAKPPPEEDTDWLALWTPAPGQFGSMERTLMIRPADLAAHRFDRSRTLSWQ